MSRSPARWRRSASVSPSSAARNHAWGGPTRGPLRDCDKVVALLIVLNQVFASKIVESTGLRPNGGVFRLLITIVVTTLLCSTPDHLVMGGNTAELHRKAELRDPEAMYSLAVKFYRGWGGHPVDVGHALALWGSASEHWGHSPSRVALADYYMCEVATHCADPAKALQLYRDANHGDGVYSVAMLHKKKKMMIMPTNLCSCVVESGGGGGCGVAVGVGGGDVWDEFVGLLGEAVDMGSSRAMCELGWCYQNGIGVRCDPSRAVSLYNRAAGAAKSSVRLGVCYLWGVGVERDVERALITFNQSSSRDAVAYVAWCYSCGCGVERDMGKAISMLSGPANAGNGRCMVFLGNCHERGDGGAFMPNPNKARELYNRANQEAESKESGGREAFGELGLCYQKFVGTPADRIVASFFQMGADAGDPVAMFHLAVCLSKGDGVEQNVQLLRQQVQALNKQLGELTVHDEQMQGLIQTMTSMISADISNFILKRLLVVENANKSATFIVQYNRQPNSSSSGGDQELQQEMVMKVHFNWENTPTPTRQRRQFFAECMNLSLIPHHPNVICPLGAIVIPRYRLPASFMEQLLPTEGSPTNSNNKALGILMPYCGITLSAFLTLFEPSSLVGVAVDLFLQALEAVHHLESHCIVHRDIKEENILVHPDTRKLTLRGFSHALHCGRNNTQMILPVSAQPPIWGNTETMPPELSTLRNSDGTAATISYSKCDSFALALTFYNALLPQSHRFIGNTTPLFMDMSQFNTTKLQESFPLPPGTAATEPTIATSQHDQEVIFRSSVLIGMMNPEKPKRVTTTEAKALLHPKTDQFP
ncbi:sel1 repeat family protein [Pelomyxa schiedti]|nr:sel1 repeat family protein [Pelomyxa schiedti]